MALNTDPAIPSPLRKTLLGTPVFIASRRSRGLFATMTTSLPCRCLRCSSPSGEVYREIPSAPGRASLESSKKAISVLPSSSSTQSASDPLRRVGVCRARLSAGGVLWGFDAVGLCEDGEGVGRWGSVEQSVEPHRYPFILHFFAGWEMG